MIRVRLDRQKLLGFDQELDLAANEPGSVQLAMVPPGRIGARVGVKGSAPAWTPPMARIGAKVGGKVM